MNVQPINFCGNISKGRKEFEKLSDYEKIALKTTEKVRQKYNQTHVPPITTKNTDLAEYVRLAASIDEFVKKRIGKVFSKLRKQIGV